MKNENSSITNFDTKIELENIVKCEPLSTDVGGNLIIPYICRNGYCQIDKEKKMRYCSREKAKECFIYQGNCKDN